MLIEFGSVEDSDFEIASNQPIDRCAGALILSIFGPAASLRARGDERRITPFHTDGEKSFLMRRMFQLVPVGPGTATSDRDGDEQSRSWTYDVTYQRDTHGAPLSATVTLVRYWDEPFEWNVILERNGVRTALALPGYREGPIPFAELAPAPLRRSGGLRIVK